MSTENRDNLIRILGNLIEDSKQTVHMYWNGTANEFHKTMESLQKTLTELDRTHIE